MFYSFGIGVYRFKLSTSYWTLAFNIGCYYLKNVSRKRMRVSVYIKRFYFCVLRKVLITDSKQMGTYLMILRASANFPEGNCNFSTVFYFDEFLKTGVWSFTRHTARLVFLLPELIIISIPYLSATLKRPRFGIFKYNTQTGSTQSTELKHSSFSSYVCE